MPQTISYTAVKVSWRRTVRLACVLLKLPWFRLNPDPSGHPLPAGVCAVPLAHSRTAIRVKYYSNPAFNMISIGVN